MQRSGKASFADVQEEMVAVDKVVDYVANLMPVIQADIFAKALAFRDANIHRVDTWGEFATQFEGEGGGGFVLAHWDGTPETEAKISEMTKATIRCIPLEPLAPDDAQTGKCVLTGAPSKQRVIFAKAY